ncbi:MAG: hypothetical protein EA339_15240 [Rhodobacteraceae bacterium]|nr:MAG: hypothetical protein EA339_15240 [Paracoccaceae bacterium]
MEQWLKEIQNRLLQDQTVRLAVAGGLSLLLLIVIADAFGARERSASVRETLRTVAEDAPTSTVPSVYRVPRDLATEMALAARAAEAPSEPAIAEADPVAPEIVEPEVAEAEPADADVIEPELAEAEATEAPTNDLAEAEAPEQDAAVADVIESVADDATATEDDATEEAATETAQTEDDATDAAPAEIAVAGSDDGLALLAGADLDNGQRVWRQCAACHVYESEQNRGGPHLVNIIGRDIGVAEGWRYSRALQEHGGVWNVENLLAWLENPDTFIPGNQMAFRGLRNEQDRIDLLGLLSQSAQD